MSESIGLGLMIAVVVIFGAISAFDAQREQSRYPLNFPRSWAEGLGVVYYIGAIMFAPTMIANATPLTLYGIVATIVGVVLAIIAAVLWGITFESFEWLATKYFRGTSRKNLD